MREFFFSFLLHHPIFPHCLDVQHLYHTSELMNPAYSPQWSYKKGMAAGILPTKAYQRDFDCNLADIPSFEGLPEYY